jgi:hypothetical protein
MSTVSILGLAAAAALVTLFIYTVACHEKDGRLIWGSRIVYLMIHTLVGAWGMGWIHLPVKAAAQTIAF